MVPTSRRSPSSRAQMPVLKTEVPHAWDQSGAQAWPRGRGVTRGHRAWAGTRPSHPAVPQFLSGGSSSHHEAAILGVQEGHPEVHVVAWGRGEPRGCGSSAPGKEMPGVSSAVRHPPRQTPLAVSPG